MDNHDEAVRYPPFISDNGGPSPDASPLNALQDPLPRARSTNSIVENLPRLRKRHRPSASTLLVVTNERLTQQTALARTLQAQSDDVFSVLKTTYQNNLNLQAHLTKAQSELALYKHQLQIAEGEIRKAEEIVKDVDRLRLQAEERSVRDREKLRKLIEERAIWIAKEEGRREGFQLGLEEGRRIARALHGDDMSRNPRAEEESGSTPSRSRSAISTASTRSRAGGPPTVVHSQPRSPGPSRNQSRLPEQEMQRRASSAASIRHRPLKTPRPEPESRPSLPEDIRPVSTPSIQRPMHPISIQNREPPSPSISHRDIALPPEGFIPTKSGALGHEYIPLPPPHELSIPVGPLEGDPRSVQSALGGPRRDHDGAKTPTRARGRARTISSASGASTRVSEFDLVSPPRGAELRDPRLIQSNGTARNVRSPSQKKVEEWRRNSAEVVSPQPRRIFTIANASPGDHIGEDSLDTEVSQMPAPASTRPMPKTPVNVTPATPRPESRSTVITPPDPPIVQQLQEGDPPRRKTPLAWLRSRFQRSHSSPGGVANIQIQVEPPSASQSSTETNSGTVIDPVLLTPEHANRPFTPDAMFVEVDKPQGPPANPVTIVLPDENLPPGFVPQSPMMPLSPLSMSTNAAIPAGPSIPDYPRTGSTRPRVATPNAPFLSPISRFGTYLSPAPLNRPISLFSED